MCAVTLLIYIHMHIPDISISWFTNWALRKEESDYLTEALTVLGLGVIIHVKLIKHICYRCFIIAQTLESSLLYVSSARDTCNKYRQYQNIKG